MVLSDGQLIGQVCATHGQPCASCSQGKQGVMGVSTAMGFPGDKAGMNTSPTLTLYNPEWETTVAADVSSCDIGSVLTQQQPDGSE